MFRKDFYIEVPDLAKMTDAEVEEYRIEMEGIKVLRYNNSKKLSSFPVFKMYLPFR